MISEAMLPRDRGTRGAILSVGSTICPPCELRRSATRSSRLSRMETRSGDERDRAGGKAGFAHERDAGCNLRHQGLSLFAGDHLAGDRRRHRRRGPCRGVHQLCRRAELRRELLGGAAYGDIAVAARLRRTGQRSGRVADVKHVAGGGDKLEIDHGNRLGIEENRRCRGYLWHDLVTAMITTIDKIRADAFNEDELLHCAFVDATDALCRLAVNGRTTVEAIRILESWRSALETAERRRTHEKARRA
jgi:hypothetical protein